MGVDFDQRSADRISQVVRWAEHFPKTRHYTPTSGLSFGPQRWIPCQNAHSTNAPAFGIAKVTGVGTLDDGRIFYSITRPDSSIGKVYVCLGQNDIAAGDYGMCTLGPDCRFLFDSGAVSNGQTWGPKNGQWTATSGGPAFLTAAGQLDGSTAVGWLHENPPGLGGYGIQTGGGGSAFSGPSLSSSYAKLPVSSVGASDGTVCTLDGVNYEITVHTDGIYSVSGMLTGNVGASPADGAYTWQVAIFQGSTERLTASGGCTVFTDAGFTQHYGTGSTTVAGVLSLNAGDKISVQAKCVGTAFLVVFGFYSISVTQIPTS